jgi:hypothetical protein
VKASLYADSPRRQKLDTGNKQNYREQIRRPWNGLTGTRNTPRNRKNTVELITQGGETKEPKRTPSNTIETHGRHHGTSLGQRVTDHGSVHNTSMVYQNQ